MINLNPFKQSHVESQIADVLHAHEVRLEALSIDRTESESEIEANNALLVELGIVDELILPLGEIDTTPDSSTLPSWLECLSDAQRLVGAGHKMEDLFTLAELKALDVELGLLNEEYLEVHHLDVVDLAIPVAAGLISALVDTLSVGVPQRTAEGLRAGPFENYVRDWFEHAFPAEEMELLARKSTAKVPYDAPYNSGFTSEYVEGLWSSMHRLYSLGHDPLLGLVVGTHDILNGKMTTIDKLGEVVCQKMDERYEGREEATIFAALCKQVIHMKTDVNTAMGLPAPFMGLFNLMQFGSIGEEEQTIAEIIQGMYYEGYDFKHFCAQSMPVMLAEVIVRLGYCLKRISEGHSIRESVPLTTNRKKRPKLGTMLFIAHAIATGVNAGKVAFTKNPMEISYPQWIAFSLYSFKQAKWALIEKPYENYRHVMDLLEADIARMSMPTVREPVAIGAL